MARSKVDELSRMGESLRTQIVSTFVRFKDRGAVPETVQELLAQESRIRNEATKSAKRGETERAANLTAQADIIKDRASIKATDTDGALSQPAPDWVAPATTLYTTGQVQGIIADLQAGKSMQEIIKAITWVITSIYNAIKSIVLNIWKVVVWVLNKVWQLAKFIWAWLVEAFVETLNQLWTLLGMFAAWLVLEGSAKTIVGYAIITVLFIWLITMRIREGEE
jgi:hypothetical protein